MKRKTILNIKLSDEEKKKICEEIAAFYLEERDEEIGIIAQQQILELFMESLAPIIYNRALDDVKVWYSRQQDNLDSDYYMLYKKN